MTPNGTENRDSPALNYKSFVAVTASGWITSRWMTYRELKYSNNKDDV